MARRASGLALLFFILAVFAGFGDGQRKVANALGLLVTVGYVTTERNAFTAVGNYFAGSSDKGSSSGSGTVQPFPFQPTPSGSQPVLGEVP